MAHGPDHIFPVVIVADRYAGLYSGAPWFAIAQADTPFHEVGDLDPTRAGFCLEEGPNDPDDSEAQAFWAKPPYWIAAGHSPQAAMEALLGAYP